MSRRGEDSMLYIWKCTSTNLEGNVMHRYFTIAVLGTFFYQFTLIGQIPTNVPKDSLVGWWSLNGNGLDESGNGNHGNIEGNGFYAVDSTISSSCFNGTGYSAIRLQNVNKFPLLSKSRTISLEFKLNNLNQLSSHIELFCYGSNAPGYRFGIKLIGNEIGLESCLVGNYATWSPDTNWHKVIVSFDSINNNLEIYLDGVLLKSSRLNYTLTVDECCPFIGSIFGIDGGPPFYYSLNGKLRNIGLWGRSFTRKDACRFASGLDSIIISSPKDINVNPQSSAIFYAASNYTLSTYQWQTNLGTGFQNLEDIFQYSGVKTQKLTIDNVTLANHNQPFRCIIETNGCYDTTAIAVLKVRTNVSVDEKEESPLLVYPNPTSESDELLVQCRSDQSRVISIEMIDIIGITRAYSTINVQAGAYPIRVSGLAKGMYTLRVHTSSGIMTEKVIIN
jgi:hypothetical protein